MAQAPPCPYCDATSYKLQERRWLLCTACETQFDVQTDVCRACGRLNKADAANCAYCQAKLPRSPVEHLIEARTKDRLGWHQERTEVSVRQKVDEERASRERMEAYWAEEHARREAAALATMRRRDRERKTLIVVGVISAILILTLLAVALALSQWSRLFIG